MARLSRHVASAAAVVAAAAGLAACGGGANGDALAACRGVHRAIAAYDASLVARTDAAKSRDLRDATEQLALVQQDAAMANSSDGSYDAFMTLVQQAQEVPFGDVVPALTTVCKAIDSSTSYL